MTFRSGQLKEEVSALQIAYMKLTAAKDKIYKDRHEENDALAAAKAAIKRTLLNAQKALRESL